MNIEESLGFIYFGDRFIARDDFRESGQAEAVHDGGMSFCGDRFFLKLEKKEKEYEREVLIGGFPH